MPDDYYVSQYSGEEIDDLLGKAGSATGAVRYDAAQTLTDSQKQQARKNIAAAPSGFGWGEELPQLVSTAAEVDAITANSIVRYANDSTNLVDGDSGSYTRYAIVVTYTVNATDKAQDVYGYGGGAHGDVMLHRGRFGNTWLPWEWVNPPMQFGVEYRTTERYLGKPVYVKVVSLGKLVTGHITYEVGDDEISSIISCTATVSSVPNSFNGRYTLPNIISNSLTDSWSTYVAFIDKAEIVVYCGGSMAGSEARAIIKYIKSTD